MSYKRFFAMIATSTVAMFILMYSTVYSLDHVFWSSTKTYMALYMGATMAVIMLAFMLKMYDNKKANIAIFVGSALLFAVVFWVFRSQANVGDVTYMRQMIPHHSLAILTSERAEISDPRVRRLADDIIHAQRLEIAEMEALIADLENRDYDAEAMPPTVPPIEGGSEEVPGAPNLTVAEVIGEVVMVAQAKVESDAWIVIHPAATGGGPDPTTVIGKAFLRHGETENVPVGLETAVASGTTLYAMLHDDTGQIGSFEFGGSGGLDQPLMQNGSPVVISFVVQ
jgi:hypothetical protein